MINLPRFRRYMKCPKCEYDGDMKNQYDGRWTVVDGSIQEDSVYLTASYVEAVKRTCPDCGYVEYQRPADYEEK